MGKIYTANKLHLEIPVQYLENQITRLDHKTHLVNVHHLKSS
jgi:hypothetical protein